MPLILRYSLLIQRLIGITLGLMGCLTAAAAFFHGLPWTIASVIILGLFLIMLLLAATPDEADDPVILATTPDPRKQP